MKIAFGLILICNACFLSSCGNYQNNKVEKSKWSYEIFGPDTINHVDENGLRQGKWYLYNEKHVITDTVFYKDDKIIKNE